MDEFGQELNLVVDKIIQTKTNIDARHEHYKIPFNKRWNNRFYEFVTVDSYGSGQQGSRIRNAVTGYRYPYFVGSSDEALLFKVSDATGRYKRKERLALYYDSPEQFENHHFITLGQHVKDKWYRENTNARKRLLTDKL